MNFDSFTTPVIDFVRDHQAWAAPIVAALAFGESLAVLSLLIPATVILLGIGALLGAAGIGLTSAEFWIIWAAGALGAFLGDWVSYEFARAVGGQARGRWPLNRQPGLVLRAEAYMTRFGVWGVFLGRFFGPLRALVPLVAGMFEMARLPFQAANLASAAIWSFIVLAPGAGLLAWLES